jgi:hypothetical protein
MSHTGKAGNPRPKPPKLKGETQFQRFVETVNAVEADATGAEFDRAMKVIAPAKLPPDKSSDRKSKLSQK